MDSTLNELILKAKASPDKPGVYLFKNVNDEVIYVGKAKSLKKRINSYFLKGAIDTKSKVIRDIANDFETIITESETEALILENNLIKLHKPLLNIRLTDDKTYPFLMITTSEEYPRVEIVRKRENANNRYFGPYADVKALKNALKKAITIFPIASCKKKIIIGKFDRSCLYFQLNRCAAPCIEKIEKDEYEKIVQQFIKLFEGKQSELMIELRKDMETAAENMDFEAAAVIRDKISALDKIIQRQIVVSKDMTAEFDIVSIVYDENTASIQLLIMKQGRIIEQKNFLLNIPIFLDESEILSTFIKQYYAQTETIPKKILLEISIEDEEIINKWLDKRFRKGKDIIIYPKSSEEKDLIVMAKKNAEANLGSHLQLKILKEKRVVKGLEELKKVLELEEIPARIEGYDISTLQGTNTVASCVVFVNGIPKKSKYRKFSIKSLESQDDFRSMREVIKRRFTGSLATKEDKPTLIVIDGGPGQVNFAYSVLKEHNIEIPLIGIAKEFEEIHFPDERKSIQLNERSEALRIIKQVRDEAHRFAITFHKQKRSKKMIESSLEKIPNIGKQRMEVLLRHFGTIENIKKATINELIQVKGINKKIAEQIKEFYKSKLI
ncbi:MAG: excinuclease ABC subunit UvrC [Candidatus Heimdallarchaeota archaeon]